MKPNPWTLSTEVEASFSPMPPYPQRSILPMSYLHIPTSYLPFFICFPSQSPSHSFTLNNVLSPLPLLFFLCSPLHHHHLCSYSFFLFFATSSKKLCCQQLCHRQQQEVMLLTFTLSPTITSCVANHHKYQLCFWLHSHQQEVMSFHCHQ